MERWRNFDCYNFLFFLRFNVKMFMISKITTNPIKKKLIFFSYTPQPGLKKTKKQNYSQI